MKRMILFSLLLSLPLSAAEGAGERFTLPRIPGWTPTADSAVYDPTNLWDLIDGAAEVFLSYRFEELTLGEYTDAESTLVRVEIYRHASPVMAFGMYAAERAPEYRFVEIGTEGYIDEGVLNFLAGPFYCKLSTHAVGSTARKGLLAVAKGVDRALGEKRGWPAGLSLLPTAGRKLRSEGFVAESALGYPFLRGAFTAEYGSGIRLYAITCAKPDSADALARRFAATTPGMELRRHWWRINDPNNGPIYLLVRGEMFYAISGASETAAELLTRGIRR